MTMSYPLIFILALGAVALLAWIRLAPDDPARWHLALDRSAPASPSCAEALAQLGQANPARLACLTPGTPAEVLGRLDATALAAPRTTRLAGTTEEGRITWVQRSFLMGYPDYITAEASQTPQGTRLDVLSRQRYGNGDWGVNAARLRSWLAGL